VVTGLPAAVGAWRSRLRQLWTTLALMPCDIAIFATEALGRSHSARIFAFNSGLCRRRVRLEVVVIVSMMLLMDTIVVGYDFGFKMGSPRAYDARALLTGHGGHILR
jgi:hypothetical protein